MQTLREFDKAIKKDNINSVLIQKNNTVIYEYFRNSKMKEKQHKIYSVTKSILSALIGIAIDKGYIDDVNSPIIHYFPQFKNDKENQRITIKHLLTMTSGLHWPGNNAMIPSKNWVNFVLNQDVEYPPGQEMVYSCGTSQLLSAILQMTTGADTENFAKKHLFTPLEITDYKWDRDAQGIPIGGFELKMRTVDMLKVGKLYVNKGRWKSKQIISTQWIEESTSPKVTVGDGFTFAYHWWNKQIDNQIGRIVMAVGFEGQYIILAPDDQLVAVFTSSIKDDSSRPISYVKDYLLPYVMNQ